MVADLGAAFGLLLMFALGVFTGHRWATESRRLDDFIEDVEAENPHLPPWCRHDDEHRSQSH